MNKRLRRYILRGWWLVVLLCSCRTAPPRIPEKLAEIPFDPGHPVEVAVNPHTGYVYITNLHGYHTGVLRGLEQVATLQTGEHANALAVDEKNGWVYVVNEYSDSVTVIQDTEIITTLEAAGRQPRDVAVEPHSGWAYVVSGHKKETDGIKRTVEGNVTVISGTQKIGVIPLGDVLAIHVAANPVNGYVYVGCVGGDIVVVDGMKVIARLSVKSTVKAIDVDPRNGDVCILNGSRLFLVRGIEVIDQTKLGESVVFRNMRVHPISGDVYAVDFTGEVVVVRDMQIVGHIPVKPGALKMAIDPLTGNVYVASFEYDTVAVIHGTELLTTFDVGWYPYGIGVNPANGWVYVSNSNANTVTVLGFPDD